MNKGNIIRLSESDLKDIIKDTANAIISEMAYPASFNMEEFKSLKSFAKRMEYCKSRLPRLGAGSSRVVFRVDDDKVLKLAKKRKSGIKKETLSSESKKTKSKKQTNNKLEELLAKLSESEKERLKEML